MEKKLFFKFSDNCDIRNVVISLEAAMEWIKNDVIEADETDLIDYQYTLIPVYMTDQEFEKLPEADI